jgi:hypothetical protein
VETVLQGVVIVGGSMLGALAAMMLVRRWVAVSALEAHSEVAGFVYAVLGVVYAVTLAFVVVVVWQQFETAKADAEAEASALIDLARLASALTDSDRRRVHEVLLAYTGAVIDEEWDSLSRGEASRRASEQADELWRVFRQVEPRTEREKAFLAQSLTQLTAFDDARRLRLFVSQDAVPAVLWAVLIAGAILVVGFSLLFGVRNPGSHAAITAAVAASISLPLFLIVAFDHPFRGGVRVHPSAFERALAVIETEMRVGLAPSRQATLGSEPNLAP